MKVTNSFEAFLKVSSVWNQIAELTGQLIFTTKRDLDVLADSFEWPTGWQAFFWGLISWVGWAVEQYSIVRDMLAVIQDSIGKWAVGVRIIIQKAVESDELGMPKHLANRVMRGDDAARYVIREMLNIAISVENSSAREVRETILEVANVSAFDPEDPTDRPESLPTARQRLWEIVLSIMVRSALLFMPFAIGYVSALWYLGLWDKPAAVPTLAQDSKRVRRKQVSSRHRVNLRKGRDKG